MLSLLVNEARALVVGCYGDNIVVVPKTVSITFLLWALGNYRCNGIPEDKSQPETGGVIMTTMTIIIIVIIIIRLWSYFVIMNSFLLASSCSLWLLGVKRVCIVVVWYGNWSEKWVCN